MMKKILTTAERLEQALNDLEAGKKATAERAAESAPELEALAKLQAKLEGLPYDERRKVLDAAGLQHVSAAPKPITPLTGRGAVAPAHQTTARTPNWQEWKHTPEVRVWQACALSLDIDPHSMIPLRDGWMAGPGTGPLFESSSFPDQDTRNEFESRMRVLLANLSNPNCFSPSSTIASAPGNSGVRLAEFAYWAVINVEWDNVPPDMVDLAMQQSEILYPSNERITPFDALPSRHQGPPNKRPAPNGQSVIWDDGETTLSVSEFSEFVTNGVVIDWDYWVADMPKLDALQAARLMAGLEPDVFESLESRPNNNDSEKKRVMSKRMQRLAEAQGQGKISPSEWLHWADEHRFEVHSSFRVAVAAKEKRLQERKENTAYLVPAAEPSPKENRAALDITTTRGCRRRILENWDTVEMRYGPNADGRQVLRILNEDKSETSPELKTVQNHLAALRKEKLIP